MKGGKADSIQDRLGGCGHHAGGFCSGRGEMGLHSEYGIASGNRSPRSRMGGPWVENH